MQLEPLFFDKATDIRFEFQLETTGENRFRYPLIAKFIGTYRPGSAGKIDARFIYGITNTAIEMWNAAAVILDLKELSYIWGDDMALLLDVGSGKGVWTAVVGSSRLSAR